jgi:hypothetical protein
MWVISLIRVARLESNIYFPKFICSVFHPNSVDSNEGERYMSNFIKIDNSNGKIYTLGLSGERINI